MTHILKFIGQTFTAKDSGGNVNFHFMTWTDPCTGFAHGTTSTVTTGCTISTIDGVDNGNIVIGQGGSITINDGATLAYAPGYSVSKTGTGSISLGSTGIITKQYLFTLMLMETPMPKMEHFQHILLQLFLKSKSGIRFKHFRCQ